MRSRFTVGALALFVAALATIDARNIDTLDELKAAADKYRSIESR